MMDPPAHDRLRALVSRVRAVQSFEPIVREVIETYVEPLDGRDRFDAVTELSGPFPVEIIARILGVPEGDRQQIRHWLDLQLHREPGGWARAEGEAAALEAGAYFYGLVREKRRHPGDDMISRLTQAEVDREDGQGVTKLDDKEIAGFATLLGGAGPRPSPSWSPTPSCCSPPGPVPEVIDDRGVIPAAVEEILRIWPPSQYQGRFSLQDAEFGGVPAGRTSGAVDHRLGHPGQRFFDDPRRARHRSAAQPVTRLRARHPQLPGPRWHAWRAASPSRRWSGAGHATRSTRTACAACTCPTSPASPACRFTFRRRLLRAVTWEKSTWPVWRAPKKPPST